MLLKSMYWKFLKSSAWIKNSGLCGFRTNYTDFFVSAKVHTYTQVSCPNGEGALNLDQDDIV